MARPFGPAMLEKIRLGYADLDTTLDETAAKLGIAKGTMVNLARKCGWPQRRAASAALRRPTRPTSELTVLERVSAREIARLAAELPTNSVPDPERVARAVAIHVRTQQALHKLQSERAEEPQADDEPPPRTLSELRDELLRHLERIRSERRAQELRDEPDQG